jgi:hypothetical protein
MVTKHTPTRTAAIVLVATFLSARAPTLRAQGVDDGVLMSRRAMTAGVVYARDSWSEYWEGTRLRSNGNVGTVTTQSIVFVGAYGVTDRLTVFSSLPYVWTGASQGTLQPQSGVQDLAVAAKYRLARLDLGGRGALSAFVAGAAMLPATEYSPDLMPLSIGTGGGRASGRLTLGYQSNEPWFANLTAAYTWCANVKLNRNSYFTNGQLFLTNEVDMPDVVDYAVSAGYRAGRWHVPVALVQQRTLGGGDIRRQDMPFVSNRFDFTRLDAAAMYALRVPKDVALRIGFSRVLNGRNVGQSTTLSSGLFYAFNF